VEVHNPPPMSEERTRGPSATHSFEERVFARFDAMDERFNALELSFEARFDAVDARLDGLDTRVQALEARALDTKPIWERALAEIIEVKEGEDIKRKFEIVSQGAIQSARRPTVC
jgi:hypothetical protein